jgi:hypothetical protein
MSTDYDATSILDQARAASSLDESASATPGRGTRNHLMRRVAGALGLAENGYRDSLFERPDRIEDDYYRLRNRPGAGQELTSPGDGTAP